MRAQQRRKMKVALRHEPPIFISSLEEHGEEHDKVERRTLLVARSCPLALSQGSGHPWTLFF